MFLIFHDKFWSLHLPFIRWVARGVNVIVVGNRHGDLCSKPGRDCLLFSARLYSLERYEFNYSPSPQI